MIGPRDSPIKKRPHVHEKEYKRTENIVRKKIPSMLLMNAHTKTSTYYKNTTPCSILVTMGVMCATQNNWKDGWHNFSYWRCYEWPGKAILSLVYHGASLVLSRLLQQFFFEMCSILILWSQHIRESVIYIHTQKKRETVIYLQHFKIIITSKSKHNCRRIIMCFQHRQVYGSQQRQKKTTTYQVTVATV